MPSDRALKGDLAALIPLLEEIYERPIEAGEKEVRVTTKSLGTRRMADAEVRRAIEFRAMDHPTPVGSTEVHSPDARSFDLSELLGPVLDFLIAIAVLGFTLVVAMIGAYLAYG